MDPDYARRLTPNKKLAPGSPSCRYIPTRGAKFHEEFQVHQSERGADEGSSHSNSTYEALLRNELLGGEQSFVPTDTRTRLSTGDDLRAIGATSPPTPARNFFRYASPAPSKPTSAFSSSPMSSASQILLSRPRQAIRKITKTPVKTLEAPAIQDDFYLHLVDWSSTNLLAVGLTQYVYIWNALTSSVTRLCDVGQMRSTMVTSVGWMERGSHLAIGTQAGNIEIWDAERSQRVRTYVNGHASRVGTLGWNTHTLTSGGRDSIIYHRDVRCKERYSRKLRGHQQEVCGLSWSPDGEKLASGGNDNHLLVWDAKKDVPRYRFLEHEAAVKAIAWSPHQRGLLVSGGGTADRSIRFWNTLTGDSLCKIDTGSQVCNLAWSKNVNEIVSTHGYSQNQIVVWSYPSMSQLAMLTGHTMRVLYLAVSPDGTTIVTGAGDETLRFWNVFPAKEEAPGGSMSSLTAAELR